MDYVAWRRWEADIKMDLKEGTLLEKTWQNYEN